jgi:hypothetical protein
MFFSSFQVSCISNIYRHDWGLRVAVVFLNWGPKDRQTHIAHVCMVMFKRKTMAFLGPAILRNAILAIMIMLTQD